jgi:hypothetical protein
MVTLSPVLRLQQVKVWIPDERPLRLHSGLHQSEQYTIAQLSPWVCADGALVRSD